MREHSEPYPVRSPRTCIGVLISVDDCLRSAQRCFDELIGLRLHGAAVHSLGSDAIARTFDEIRRADRRDARRFVLIGSARRCCEVHLCWRTSRSRVRRWRRNNTNMVHDVGIAVISEGSTGTANGNRLGFDNWRSNDNNIAA